MFENMDPKKKSILSWIIFLVLLFIVGFLAYYYLSARVLDYRMGICLEEFNQAYTQYGFIYEYDLSCKDIFSDYNNLDYCINAENKNFCYYSFANFIEDKSISDEICSKISDVKLVSECV